jgi:fibronectin type 3 domain-containing protein
MQGEYSTIPVMAYDSVNNICLLVAWLGDKGHETWALDMTALQWRKLDPSVEPLPSGSRARNLSYDPTQNVFILDSWRHENKPEIWTYRYRKAAATTRPAPPTELAAVTRADSATLTWRPSPTEGVTYHVLRAETDKPWLAEFVEVGATRDAMFDDRGLAPGRVYLYIVCAEAAGARSDPSRSARTQPRVIEQVTVAAKAMDRVEVRWEPSAAGDVVGYNVYRALATVATSTTMAGSWAHNDPAYKEPVVDAITDLTNLTKLNAQPVTETTFVDTRVGLKRKAPESADYGYAVYAYFVRAVNRLGVESGPSPYALTIPAEPKHVEVREKGGRAGLRWEAAAESSVVGYHIYRVVDRKVERVTSKPVRDTHFTYRGTERSRFTVTSVDVLGQEGQPSSPAWCGQSYPGFYEGEWHQ